MMQDSTESKKPFFLLFLNFRTCVLQGEFSFILSLAGILLHNGETGSTGWILETRMWGENSNWTVELVLFFRESCLFGNSFPFLGLKLRSCGAAVLDLSLLDWKFCKKRKILFLLRMLGEVFFQLEP